MEWNLVWSHDHKSDFKVGRARSASFYLKSQVRFRTKIARHEVQLPLLQPFWNRRIQSVPILYWSSSRFVEKRTRKGGYISFCIRNRNDLIWYRAKMGQFTEHEWRDLEQMWFRAKNSVIFELITLLRANQIAGITSGFKMDIMKF